jgi:transposase-like protein
MCQSTQCYSNARRHLSLNKDALVPRALSRRRRACCSVTSAVTIDDDEISYNGCRFPPEIVQQAIWLYVRFTLSFRDVEDLLAESGIMVSYEAVRRWVNHFGPQIAADLSRRRSKPHTIWHLDEGLCHVAK